MTCQYPERNVLPPRTKVVPGVKLYSEAHIKNTVILSDSMTSFMNSAQLNNNLNVKEERAVFKKFPGATSSEIAHYAVHPLTNIQPSRVIVVAGTNDLRQATDTILGAEEITRSIIKIGKLAREHGVTDISISGLVKRRDTRYTRIIPRINYLLQAECLRENFVFIDQELISHAHLRYDGVHLNNFGTAIMKMNILKCFDSFNPYFNDFLTLYENAI